jgi:hypothetical protein
VGDAIYAAGGWSAGPLGRAVGCGRLEPLGHCGRWGSGLAAVAGRFLSPPSTGSCLGQPNGSRWLSSLARSPGQAELGPVLTCVIPYRARDV